MTNKTNSTNKTDKQAFPLQTISLQAVLILAGGQSRRMGTDKALLTLPSKQTLLEHHINGAMAVADKLDVPILIADNQKNFLTKIPPIYHSTKHPNPIITIDDYQAGQGALSAIAGAMLASEKLNKTPNNTNLVDNANLLTPYLLTPYLLVVSCDTIITADKIWQQLQTHLHKEPATHQTTNSISNSPKIYCFTDGEYNYPLLGLYPYALQPALLDYLQTGLQRVISFIKPYQVNIELPKHWQGLVNINTPEQFNKACTLLG